jgi:hypothetical protein
MKRNFKVFAQRTYTAIEPQWDVRPPESSGEPAYERLEYKGCDVYKYHSKAKQGTDITSYGNREFLGHFDSIDEAKTYYPKGLIQ